MQQIGKKNRVVTTGFWLYVELGSEDKQHGLLCAVVLHPLDLQLYTGCLLCMLLVSPIPHFSYFNPHTGLWSCDAMHPSSSSTTQQKRLKMITSSKWTTLSLMWCMKGERCRKTQRYYSGQSQRYCSVSIWSICDGNDRSCSMFITNGAIKFQGSIHLCLGMQNFQQGIT